MRIRCTAMIALGLIFNACDLKSSTKSDPSPSDTVATQPPVTAEARYVQDFDTISRNAPTIVYVKRIRKIVGTDTSVSSRDTIRVIGGSTLIDTAVSGQVPCNGAMTVYNLYGATVTLEIWLGNSLEYRSGRVYGAGAQRSMIKNLVADKNFNRLCVEPGRLATNDAIDVLMVAGVTDSAEGTGIFLSQRHAPDANASTILVIDETGRIRTLH